MADNFLTEFDAPSAFETPAAPVTTDIAQQVAAPVAPPAPAPETNAPENTDTPSGDAPAASAELLAEFDSIGSDDEQTNTPLADSASLPENNAAVAPNSDADSQSKETEKASEADAQTENSTDGDAQTDADKETADDWEKVSPEDEEAISKLPKNNWESARRAFRGAKMEKSFLNPAVPADKWLENVEKKSPSRYAEVETAALARLASKIGEATSPVEFLDKLYTATADPEGKSEKYGSLLEAAVETNVPFILSVLNKKGYAVSEAGTEETAANALNAPAVSLSPEELAALDETFHLDELAEIYPESTEKLKTALIAAESARKELEQLTTEKTQQENSAQDTPEQIEARKAQMQTSVDLFTDSYNQNVTSVVTNKLDKDLGLTVAPEERASNPLMAFAKDAKRAIILNGFGEASDFDEALMQWGTDKPAFKTAAEAALKYAGVGEKANVENSVKELSAFADEFLSERLKMPELAFIDQMIQLIADRSNERDYQAHDIVPTTFGANPGNGVMGYGDKNIAREFDDIR